MSDRALLIALPGGFYVSGVVTWAVQLVNHLAAAGQPCGILLHAQRDGYTAMYPVLHPAVKVFDLSALGSFEASNGQIEPVVEAYVAAARSFGTRHVVLSPNLHGDCYAAAAGALRELGDSLRIVGWCHLDSAYDVRVLEHFAPMLSRTVAVSHHLAQRLGVQPRLLEIPYGVGSSTPMSGPATRRARGDMQSGPHLVYAGRMDESTKRVGSLLAMSRELEAIGVSHRLTLVGDGPAAADLEPGPSVTLKGGVAPHEVAALLASADMFVLPSKAEGLSLAMLEAMRAGCIPIVTRVRSGAGQVVSHGINGMLVDGPDDLPREELGKRLAMAVRHVWNRGGDEMARMRDGAMAAAAAYSIEVHVRRVDAMLEEIVHEPALSWTGPATFTGHGSVPPGAEQKLRGVLDSLAGQRVVIHGTGQHTRELAWVLESYRDRIIGFCDDDLTRVGTMLLDLPIYAPPGPREATAVVVSSWIHEDEILARADAAYAGKRVLGVYHAAA
jgi:glycosyltransferase involved in cell wall biosynthesis